MGCTFAPQDSRASRGPDGAEIIDQVISSTADGGAVLNVVFMGHGRTAGNL